MIETISAGTILIDGRAPVPKSNLLRNSSDSNGWSVIKSGRAAFEDTIEGAGWTFFFMAGAIRATAFGADEQKATRSALTRLIADVKSRHCNSIEITEVTGEKFLGLRYVSVVARARHLQEGTLFSGHNHSI